MVRQRDVDGRTNPSSSVCLMGVACAEPWVRVLTKDTVRSVQS